MTILSVSTLKSLRDVSFHKKDETITASIEDSENDFVKKYLGDPVYAYLLENLDASPTDSLVELIIDGGIYEDNCSPPKKHHIVGLNKAISNLVYCDLLIKQSVITRFGAVNKSDQYSNRTDFDDALAQITRYRNTALNYLQDIDYLLINIDETAYSADSQAMILAYREEYNGETRPFLQPYL